MNKLNSGYSYIRVTAAEVSALADEMDQMVQRYGWQDRTVMPWSGVKMSVAEITRNMRDFSRCSKGSKLYLIDLANGLVDIMNAWEEHELEPKMEVRNVRTGKVLKVGVEMGRMLIVEGCVVAV